MITTVFSDKEKKFEWVDVAYPSEEEFKALSDKYHLHPASVKDCLAPMHLPKYERIDDIVFMIVRIYDVTADHESDEIQQLTNKVAIFAGEEFIITIHRREEPFLTSLKEKWTTFYKSNNYTPSYVFNQLLDKSIYTYEEALKKATERLDAHEKNIFLGTKDKNLIKDLYIVKRRASVFKRMLYMTKDSIDKFVRFESVSDPFTQDLIENAETLFFQADELHENVNNLLNLHLSLASHRTNEVMGILTIFSVFFLPLTFITGLYGMNFQYMPELQSEYGYPVAIFVMAVIVMIAYVFFKKKGWF